MEYWIIDQLVQQGVRHFCIAPGSRSTPLVLAAADHERVQLHVHYDERGLGFYALGIAKPSGEPAAVIVTSGTAVGNLLPSVMEAHHSATPMILLTADRPADLRDCGANQATDQVKIFQPFVRWQVDLPCSLNEAYFRSIAAQGYFYTRQNPPGPVHLNCPFRDPLYRPGNTFSEGKPFPIQFPFHTIPAQTTPHSKGLILIGKLPHRDDVIPILELAKRLKWPVCADILSNARCHPTSEQIRYCDWIEKPRPDLVLHFGERMTSKRMLDWLKEIQTELIHISPYPFLQDPARILTSRVQADISAFCQAFDAPINDDWLSSWKDNFFPETAPLTEAHAIRSLSTLIPDDFAVFLGNGMPIRDADHFLFPKKCRGFFANRGLSGIDGNIATIAGLAQTMPILGIIGDQATLYDLNSLPLLKKTRYPAHLLISNNFGGGIFHHLPVTASPHFEQLFAAAHTMDFVMAAKQYDLPYFSFSSIEEALHGPSAIIELFTDRKANYKFKTCLQKQF